MNTALVNTVLVNSTIVNSGNFDKHQPDSQAAFLQLKQSQQLPHKQPSKQLVPGDRLYKTGQEASFIYLISQGIVKTIVHSAIGTDRIVDVYGPGEIIGVAGLEASIHVETVQAVTDATLTPIDPEHALRNVAFSKYLSTTLAKQVSRHREAIDDAALPVGARLCKKLIRLCERFGDVISTEHLRLPFALTQEEYAAAIGSSRITVSRIFSYLRSTGAVVGKRGDFVLDCERLEHAIDTYVLEIL